MVASQLNVRINPTQRAGITRKARQLGIKPTDYVRSIIDKEVQEVTISEWDRYLTWLMRKKDAKK